MWRRGQPRGGRSPPRAMTAGRPSSVVASTQSSRSSSVSRAARRSRSSLRVRASDATCSRSRRSGSAMIVAFMPLADEQEECRRPDALGDATFTAPPREQPDTRRAPPATVTRSLRADSVARAKIGCGMPIYEYECHDCRRRVSLLVLRPSAAPVPTCPRCHGSNLARVMSRFATVRSEDERLESLADASSFGDLNEEDPASVARFMKKMGKEFGDDLGDDFESAVDEALAEGEPGGQGEAPAPGASESVDAAGASDDL